jgi:hypothetical protein
MATASAQLTPVAAVLADGWERDAPIDLIPLRENGFRFGERCRAAAAQTRFFRLSNRTRRSESAKWRLAVTYSIGANPYLLIGTYVCRPAYLTNGFWKKDRTVSGLRCRYSRHPRPPSGGLGRKLRLFYLPPFPQTETLMNWSGSIQGRHGGTFLDHQSR